MNKKKSRRKTPRYVSLIKARRKYKLKGFMWVYLIGTVVVVGGAMGFGTIATIQFKLDHASSISMLGMIPIMAFIYYIAIGPVVSIISSRIEMLTKAMDEVANGNLDYQIDITKAGEFKKAYTQFNAMVLELKKTKSEMQDFTNEFAHEFKTPITAISGFSEHLLETGEEIESPERMEQLKMISEESNRLLKLSMNTLLLSKVDAMQVVVEKEKYDLAEQLRKCIILLSKELDKKEIELEMDEDLELPFYGNEELLQHVWINLLNNAIKFTPQKGTITIEGELSDDQVIVKISDSGVGMDEKTMDKIFEKYYQNDSVSIARGSGIGLSIVKRIVALCDGDVSVSSKIGMGSTFTVCLPYESNM
ncbi:MAG: HAMP domain-containing histidine kinase [Butyrivibrio sp.]|nr:HAMP domain-containing histidine kinase [Butyrivibrio sp.]